MTATVPLYRSYSQVKQLRQCGWQYKLERLDKVPSRPSAAAVAGSAIHAGCDAIDYGHSLEEAVAIARGELDVEVEAQREKGWEPEQYKRYGRASAAKPNGEDIVWFADVAVPNGVAAYADWRRNHPDFVLADVPDFGQAIEVPFDYQIGGEQVHGYIDRVLTSQRAGGFYPLDLKSGAKPKTDEQLGLYAAALRNIYGWDIHYGYYLYGLKTGTASLTLPIDLTHWTEAALAAVYGPATKAIEQGIFMPNPSEACFFCGVSDSCEFARSVI